MLLKERPENWKQCESDQGCGGKNGPKGVNHEGADVPMFSRHFTFWTGSSKQIWLTNKLGAGNIFIKACVLLTTTPRAT